MDDLHSLCKVCHTSPPQYTCPRCSIRTCSLECIKTHKRRAPCSGVRDPTIFKPMRQLATPAGIDHDYNFLSAIERSVERSDRLLVEERGIVTIKELREGPPEPREQFSGRGRGRGRDRGRGRGGSTMEGIDHAQLRGENDLKILSEARRIGVRVERLPKGMARQKLNGTSWSRKQKCIVWTIEWLRSPELSQLEKETRQGGGEDKCYSKVLTTTPLGIAYNVLQEERRRAAMTPEEKAQEKRRRAKEVDEMAKKRPRRDLVSSTDSNPAAMSESAPSGTVPEATAAAPTYAPSSVPPPPTSQAQPTDPTTQTVRNAPKPRPADPHAEGAENFVSDYTFYIRRPHTPSNLPTVLIPLDYKKPLDELLAGKVIVEFPTIYVFHKTVEKLPREFMLQDEFFERMGAGGSHREADVEEGEVSSEEEEEEKPKWVPTKPVIEDSGTSSSGSSDESSEEESSDEEDEETKTEEEKAPAVAPQQDTEMKEIVETKEEVVSIPRLNMLPPNAVEEKEEDSAMSL